MNSLKPLLLDQPPCDTCVSMWAALGNEPKRCRFCYQAHRERAELVAFASLNPGQVVRLNAYGRPIVGLVKKVNRKTFVVDGLRNGVTIDTSIACDYKATPRDLILEEVA
jgi:hypothetical protein